jgi:hypothetical protein
MAYSSVEPFRVRVDLSPVLQPSVGPPGVHLMSGTVLGLYLILIIVLACWLMSEDRS